MFYPELQGSYSDSNAYLIRAKLNSKGWNFYLHNSKYRIEIIDVIKKSLSFDLKCGVKYLILPSVDKPEDPNKVLDAVEASIDNYDAIPFSIRISSKLYSLTEIELSENSVKLLDAHSKNSNFHFSYEEFMSSIDSVANKLETLKKIV